MSNDAIRIIERMIFFSLCDYSTVYAMEVSHPIGQIRLTNATASFVSLVTTGQSLSVRYLFGRPARRNYCRKCHLRLRTGIVQMVAFSFFFWFLYFFIDRFPSIPQPVHRLTDPPTASDPLGWLGDSFSPGTDYTTVVLVIQ